MINTCDVGSLPLRGEAPRIKDGARKYNTLLPLFGLNIENLDFFEKRVLEGFIDKLKAGIDVPNYPQFRDMNEMFLSMLKGVKKTESGYQIFENLSIHDSAMIPEVKAIKNNVGLIKDESCLDRVRLKLCVTGPYTLSSLFNDRNPKLLKDLGSCIKKIVSRSLFNNKRGKVEILSVDEPVFGFIDDPILDFGYDGREVLLKAWEDICLHASAYGVKTILHLHNTSNSLFWDVEHLDIVESHVGDPLYNKSETKDKLKNKDKLLKASIAITQFDDVIEKWLIKKGYRGNIPEKIGRIWESIRKKKLDPLIILEEKEALEKRLGKIINDFGAERVPYAGPECGLSSFPSYEVALKLLERISNIVDQNYNRLK